MSVRPFARMELPGSSGRIFVKYEIRAFFENPSRKFDFFQNTTRMTDTLLEDESTFMIIFSWIFLE